jgi:hypothetical protein
VMTAIYRLKFSYIAFGALCLSDRQFEQTSMALDGADSGKPCSILGIAAVGDIGSVASSSSRVWRGFPAESTFFGEFCAFLSPRAYIKLGILC